jgi:mannose-6-phosphate isomerase-like protein (cupin superfamily)
MFNTAALVMAFERYQPEILKACREALPVGAFESMVMLDRKPLAGISPISIDYAIMEKAGNTATVIADFRWSDVGDWNSVWQETARDDNGVAARGSVLAMDCVNSLIRSEGPMLVGLGLEDMIAVATQDAVLVAPRSRAQDIKRVVDELTARGRAEASGASKTVTSWGAVETIHEGVGIRLSKITVNPAATLPLQRHRLGAAHWIGIAGEGIVTLENETIPICADRFVQVPAGAVHQLHNPGPGILRIVEVRTGGETGDDEINF